MNWGNFSQEDINRLLLWWFDAEEDSESNVSASIANTKLKVDSVTLNKKPKIEEYKTRNYRIKDFKWLEFPFNYYYNWKKVKLHLFQLSWIPFYVPVDVYKLVSSKLWNGKDFFTSREVDEIKEYIKREYWLDL